MSDKKTILSRRNFLVTVGVGGAAGAAVLVAGKGPAPIAASGVDAGKRGGEGYKLTRHVSNYYRTTKV